MTVLGGAAAIIFDLDGVLWESSAAHAWAFEQALVATGIRPPDYAGLAGRRTDEVFEALLRAAGQEPTPQRVQALTESKRAHARARLAARPPITPTTPLLLRQLALSHRLALATSASAATVELFLAAAGARTLFEVVLCGSDGLPGKPEPDIYLRVVERLRLSPAEVVVIEDAPSGVRAARAAGLRVIGLAGTVEATALEREGAAHVVRSLEELLL